MQSVFLTRAARSLTWSDSCVWKAIFFFVLQAMPLQLSSPGIGLSFRMLPVGDRHARTPCMRKENVKIFPSVRCIGKKC